MKEFIVRLPKHECSLTLAHNEHKDYYQSVSEFYDQLDCSDWVNDEEKRKAIESNDVWSIQWYPNTPVGFNLVLAHSLDVLLDFIAEQGD